MLTKNLNLMIILGVFLFTQLMPDPVKCSDYSHLYHGLNITWELTPNDIIKTYKTVENIFWLGRIEDTSVTSIPSGKVEVLWFFSHHAFINPGPQAVCEPFHVEKTNSGYFLFTIILPNTTVRQAEKAWTKKLKEPYYVLVSGRPMEIGGYNGVKTVVIDASHWSFSDNFKIIYVEN